MAAYEFLGAEQTVQVLSDEIVRDAQRVTARAVESGIVYSLLFAPYPTDPLGTVVWTPALIAEQLAYWAGIWNQNAEVPGVLGISVTQETNAAGTLVDVARVYIASSSGRSTTVLELGPRKWLPSVANTTLTESFGDAVARARAELDQVEAGGPAPAQPVEA